MLQIKKQSDERVLHAFTHKLADIPGGVTVSAARLTQGKILEGTPIGKGSDGIYQVVKTAVVAAAGTATTDTTYTVKKGHNFKVGEYIMAATGAKAYAITTIATNSGDSTCDDITVGTALGVNVAIGDVLMEAAAQSASTTSAFKFAPVALVGDAYDVEGNMVVSAVTMGQIDTAKTAVVFGSAVKKALPNINFI